MADLDYYKQLPAKRMGSGMLFIDEQERVLILKTSYKEHWEIPGGVVERDESPLEAAVREVREEIGLAVDRSSCRLLAVDYMAAGSNKTEALMFVFYGGLLKEKAAAAISSASEEICEHRFAEAADATRKLGPLLGPRIERCMRALKLSSTSYFEGAY